MAKVIEDFSFRRNLRGEYNWDEWLDGRAWQLESGVDFKIDVAAFRACVYGAATRRGLKVRTKADPEGKTVMIQAIRK